MVRNPVENRETFSSELLFSLMPLLLRLRRGKLASDQWPVRIPKFTQPRNVRVGVEIHYLTLTSGFKIFSPILFMHMHRTSCSFNVKPGYHTYICMAISQHQGFCYFFGDRNKLLATHRLSLSTKGMGVNFCFRSTVRLVNSLLRNLSCVLEIVITFLVDII